MTTTHPIPDAALAHHIAILGKTGSGKTVAAKGMVERILDAGGRVCAVDPTGVWHGLRSSASGKRAGYPVVIFGGPHGDVPLAESHGEAVAEVIGQSSTSAVIDTSLMKVSERTRFFAAFADAITRKNKGPLHLVIDECHVFMPQGKINDPHSGAMLHAANNMVSLGRSRGLRITLISQRPAKVHKDSLTQVETLVAMRLIAPQDRRAVEQWIADNADPAKGKEVIATLATLKTGEAWLWAPEVGLLDRVKFPNARTFDTSRAPDGEDGKGPVLAPIDLAAVNERLKVVVEEAKANDPKALKAEIARLKADLTKAQKNAEIGIKNAAPDPTAIADAEERGFRRGYGEATEAHRRADGTLGRMTASVSAFHEAVQKLSKDLSAHAPTAQVRAPARSLAAAIPARQAVPRSATSAARQSPPRAKSGAPNSGGGETALPPGERAVLIAACQFQGVDRDQLSVLTGYKRSSRDAYIQRLREKGFVEVAGQTIAPTDAGTSALGKDASPLPTGSELQDYWRNRLPDGERKILDALIEAYPAELQRSVLDEITGYKRSSRDAYIQRLKAKRLVEANASAVCASALLF